MRQKCLGDSELHEKIWGREVKDAKGKNGKEDYQLIPDSQCPEGQIFFNKDYFISAVTVVLF